MKLLLENWRKYLKESHPSASATEGDDVGQVIKIIKHIEKQTGLNISHEASSSNFRIELFKNKKLVGHFRTSTILPNSFEMENMPSDCKDAWDNLGEPDLWAIRGAEWFDKELRGKGYGKLLYNSLFSYVASLNGVVGPDRCSGGSTSDDAKRVWTSLYKKYPSEGPLIDLRKQNIEVRL